MKKLTMSKSLLIAIGLLLSVTIVNAQTITTTGSGNWNSTTPNAPWPGGIVPTTSNTIIIANGHTVTLTSPINQIGVITVNSGGTLICNAVLGITNDINTGGTIVNGTIDITVSNGLTKNGGGNNPNVSVSSTGRINSELTALLVSQIGHYLPVVQLNITVQHKLFLPDSSPALTIVISPFQARVLKASMTISPWMGRYRCRVQLL